MRAARRRDWVAEIVWFIIQRFWYSGYVDLILRGEVFPPTPLSLCSVSSEV
jgi:hypothetical protein